MSFDINKIEKIEGLLSDDEARLLYKLAREVKKGVIVEIGSYKGKSTVCLAQGSKDGKGQTVYAIDPHLGDLSLKKNSAPSKEDFKKNVVGNGLQRFVKPLYFTSKEAFPKIKQPIGLLFIDGDHRYKGVLADYRNWSKKLCYGGIVAFHDSFSWEGVIKTIDSHVIKNHEFVCLGFANSITYFMKAKKTDWLDHYNNWVFLMVRKVYVTIVFLHLPGFILKPLKSINRFVMPK